MALAILELEDYDEEAVTFTTDTGTSPFYQIKAGTGVRKDLGIPLVEDVYFSTRLFEREYDPFNTSRQIRIPASSFSRPGSYAQLYSFKTASRRAPAVSRPIRVPRAFGPAWGAPVSMSQTTRTAIAGPPTAVRRIPWRTQALARTASLDDVLGALLQIASPIVSGLLRPGTSDASATVPPSPPTLGGGATVEQLVAELLRSVLAAPTGQARGLWSTSQSRRVPGAIRNRFAKQLIFGIDDALIGSLIGPLVQVLPQLANAANQKRIELRKADNQLTESILSDINRRLLLERLTDSQRRAAPTDVPSPEQLQQLVDLLNIARAAAPPGQPGAPAPATSSGQPASPLPPAPGGQPAVPTPPAPSVQQSLWDTNARPFTLSSRATLTFDMAEPVEWRGTRAALFDRNKDVSFQARLNVGDPIPKAPLPKAILKIVLRQAANPAIRYEKEFRLKDLLAGASTKCTFVAGELAHLPIGEPIAVLSELRWPNPRTGKESRALGSAKLILVNQYFLKSQGSETGPEVEPKDMKRYRTFWNKVWEAPSLDAATPENGGRKKYGWELDVTTRYSVVLSADHDVNGLMEPKLLAGPGDPDSLFKKTEGRMKAGVELSVRALNDLLPLWNSVPLDSDRLAAFGSSDFLRKNAGEFKHRLRLKGQAGQGGMVWVLPTFKLFGFKIGKVSKTDDSGQVTACSEEDVAFPLPVAARLLGLKGLNP